MWMQLTSRLIAQACAHGFRTDPSLSATQAVAKAIEAGLPNEAHLDNITPYIHIAFATTETFPKRRRNIPISTEAEHLTAGLRQYLATRDELSDKRRAATISVEAAGWRGLDLLYGQKPPEQPADKVRDNTTQQSNNYREWLEAELQRISGE